jgi:hypothetical protein
MPNRCREWSRCGHGQSVGDGANVDAAVVQAHIGPGPSSLDVPEAPWSPHLRVVGGTPGCLAGQFLEAAAGDDGRYDASIETTDGER